MILLVKTKMDKLFTEKQVSISALIGGPIPPGILISLNYLRLGKEKEARIALLATLLLTFLFFLILYQLPDEVINKIPNLLFSSLYAAVVYVYYKYNMAKEIEIGFDLGHKKASNWSVTGITTLGLIGTLLIITGIVLVLPPFPGEKVDFNGNEVYYSNESTQHEAEILAAKLFEIEYFADEFENIAHLDKINDEMFITIPFDKDFWYEADIISIFIDAKLELEEEYHLPINLSFEHYTLDGKTETKTL